MGFLVQLAIGLTLLIFAIVGRDTAFLFGSLYVLLGLPVWLGLIVLFNQHKLERLEALEEDELAAARQGGEAGAESVFSRHDDEIRVAARRLRLMHRWFMPGLSLLIAAALGVLAWLMLRGMSNVAAGELEFHLTDHVGWAVAICLAFSALSFIVSRFVAGMAKQPAWQNLRGGAAYMVGNALVTLAIAVGIGFRFFKNDDVVEGVAVAIPIFMIVVAAEIVLNFVLNLYRPRIPGETPRPAFDSKLLSLFSAPDNLVRSINEAVDYQFGFDITSSWGYKLLIRSVAWLAVVGALVLMVLNMVVIVEPQEQAVKLARGRIVDDLVHGSGILWKLPWPLQSAERFDVTRIRQLHLTSKQVRPAQIQLWTDDLGQKFDKELDPFIVKGTAPPARDFGLASAGVETDGAGNEAERIAKTIALLDAEIVLSYRIREDGGLPEYLAFCGDSVPRRQQLTTREQAMRMIALRQMTQTMSRFTVNEVLSTRRAELPSVLRAEIQEAFDANGTGIEIVAVDLLMLRPAGAAAAGFEELSMSFQAREQFVANAERKVVAGLAQLVGDPNQVDTILAAIEEWERLRDTLGSDAEETIAKRIEVEQALVRGGGLASQIIAQAERDRWVRLMEARAEASRLKGQVISYRAAPRLYREREKMIVYGNTLADLYKYILCVDPSRVNFDLELTELNPMLSFSDAMDDTGQGTSGQ